LRLLNDPGALTSIRDPIMLGIGDALGMLVGLLSPDEITPYVEKYLYNRSVFVFPPWQEIYQGDAERDQTFNEAISVSKSITAWYIKPGYQVIKVPIDNIENRTDFILNKINPRDRTNMAC
jgi:predicted ATPase